MRKEETEQLKARPTAADTVRAAATIVDALPLTVAIPFLSHWSVTRPQLNVSLVRKVPQPSALHVAEEEKAAEEEGKGHLLVQCRSRDWERGGAPLEIAEYEHPVSCTIFSHEVSFCKQNYSEVWTLCSSLGVGWTPLHVQCFTMNGFVNYYGKVLSLYSHLYTHPIIHTSSYMHDPEWTKLSGIF